MQRYLRVFQYFTPVESRPYRHRQNQFGQGMTEYIIIVAIIAIGAVTASSFFGARVQTQFVAMGNEISGEAGEPVGPVAAPTPARATLGTYVNN